MQYLWDFVGLEWIWCIPSLRIFPVWGTERVGLVRCRRNISPIYWSICLVYFITNILLLTCVGTSLEAVTTVKSPALLIIEDQTGFKMDREGAAGKLLTEVSVEYRYWIKRWCWWWKPAKSELVYLGQKAGVHCVPSERLLPCSLFASQRTFSCWWGILTNSILWQTFSQTNPTLTNGNNEDGNEDDAHEKCIQINQEMHYVLWI